MLNFCFLLSLLVTSLSCISFTFFIRNATFLFVEEQLQTLEKFKQKTVSTNDKIPLQDSILSRPLIESQALSFCFYGVLHLI